MEYIPNYAETHTLLRHEGDLKGRMRPGALLRYAQQLATNQGLHIGLTEQFYAQQHCAYLLAKQALVFYRVPHVDEVLTYTTVPEKSKRASNKRLTVVTDAAGQEVALVDSRWILVDTESRRILRRPPELLEKNWNDTVERELEQRIPKPEKLQSAGVRRAAYSLCDMNGHVNNTAYVDLACDCIPAGVILNHAVTQTAVVYHREIPFGAEFELFCGECEGGYYVCGKREEAVSFEVWLKLSDFTGIK